MFSEFSSSFDAASKYHTKQLRDRTDGYNMNNLPKYQKQFYRNIRGRIDHQTSKTTETTDRQMSNQIMEMQIEILNKYRVQRNILVPTNQVTRTSASESPSSNKLRRLKRDKIGNTEKLKSL